MGVRDSPNQRVGVALRECLLEVRHRQPMLDIESGFDDRAVVEFDRKVKGHLAHRDLPIVYTVEPRMDGLAVEVVYEKGRLKAASTLGVGHRGADVTMNVKTILTVPLTLEAFLGPRPVPEYLEVRGETYMERAAFKRLNEARSQKGLPTFDNPKNAAEESLRQRDSRMTAKRELNYFCYGIGRLEGESPSTQYDLMVALQQWGLRVNRPYLKICKSVREVIDYCRHLESMRDELPYCIKGAVIKVNRRDLQAQLGAKSGILRWAFAYTFNPFPKA